MREPIIIFLAHRATSKVLEPRNHAKASATENLNPAARVLVRVAQSDVRTPNAGDGAATLCFQMHVGHACYMHEPGTAARIWTCDV